MNKTFFLILGTLFAGLFLGFYLNENFTGTNGVKSDNNPIVVSGSVRNNSDNITNDKINPTLNGKFSTGAVNTVEDKFDSTLRLESFKKMAGEYIKNIDFIKSEIYSGNRDFLDNKGLDTFIQMMYTCSIYSKNLPNNLLGLKKELEKAASIFIIPHSKGVFDDSKVEEYNNLLIEFYTADSMGYGDFYNGILPLYDSFVVSDNKAIKKYVDFYEELYGLLYEQNQGGQNVDCEKVIEQHFDIVKEISVFPIIDKTES